MRQVFAWSLVGAVLVASLLASPLPAGAGDPDIPLYHSHLHRQSPSHGPVVAQVSQTDQAADSRSTVATSPATRINTLVEMLARWMISHAMRAGH
jgi:hypothetical protein